MKPRSALRLIVRGQVQGVGFRPFVYRLALECRLGGGVRNAADGVVVEAEGTAEDLACFRTRLLAELPRVARIDTLVAEAVPVADRSDFIIEPSEPLAPPRVRIPRDLATCADCRADIRAPHNRRRGYPFTNCTACGPRYSIVTGMPYDRPATSMRCFTQCARCQTEYTSPEDRRFHAQPNACPVCGPQVALQDRHGKPLAGPDGAIPAAVALLRAGNIVAIKGLGGFQLLVRADDSNAVRRLRQRKGRPSKPFAVMVCRDEVERLARLGPAEMRELTSAANPIVLVAEPRAGTSLAAEVAPRVATLGLFLPTTPLHHLLLDELGVPAVVTSGNSNGAPILTEEATASGRLAEIAEAFLVHDRPIVRGVEDSVVRVIDGQSVSIRLGRGYAPLPLPALEELGRGLLPMLATGGQQKVAVALWTGEQAVLGQHLGDMDHPHTRLVFEATTRDLADLYRCEPARIVCDLHPDYFTTALAAGRTVPMIQVQHHHAHAAACMAEHDLLDREVLAFTWDGTGYGPDGTVWGGEVLRVGPTGYTRLGSLRPFPLPGGEGAIRHPNRSAFGLLWALLGPAVLGETHLLARLGLGPRDASLLATMIRQGIHTPWTSSVGRLFDAVAALLFGIETVTYEGEAAVWLEASVDPTRDDAYPISRDGDWRPLLVALLDDLARAGDPGLLAARFHNGLAAWAGSVATNYPHRDVVLGGGCFQNRILAERTLDRVRASGRRAYLPGLVPPGDGGLAVGQLAVALLQSSRR